ncbi:MAG: hypothetical protein ACQET7_13755 [Thermodesulfobacteriota bacterium]
MEPDFNEILSLDDVKGVMVLSGEGRVLFERMIDPAFDRVKTKSKDWGPLLTALEGVREADFLLDNLRIYMRQSAGGYILVLMGHFAPIAMVRLNCDIVLPALKRKHGSKGLGRFFKLGK